MAADSRMSRRDPGSLARAVFRYRVMAYVTGTVLIVLVFAGIPLQILAHNDIIANDVGTVHGILYLIYLGVAFWMTMQVGMKPATPATVLVLLAGTIPVLTFVVERWVTRRFIHPALAAAGGAAADGRLPGPGLPVPPSPQRPG